MEKRAENKSFLELESGVRKYAKPGPLQVCYQLWLAKRLTLLGKGVFIEPNVKFLRHPENISIGNNVIIKEGSRLCPANKQAKISIGDWTTIGFHNFIFSSLEISIGKSCLIGPFCYLVDASHGIAKGKLIREQKMVASPIIIEDDVWLGQGSTVLSGVRIARGAVIGAGSVVSNDLPAFAIAYGNPVKIVGFRE